MTDGNPKRRSSDDEAFLYQIVATQAEIKAKYELMYDMVKAEVREVKDHLSKTDAKYESLKESLNDKYDTLRDAIAGGLTKPGILEQNRNLVKDLAKLGGILSLVGFIIWKIISPLYDAWVSKWAQQKIAASVAAEPQTPAKIVRKNLPPKPVDAQIKKQ